MYELDYEKYFKIHMFALKLTKLHPNTKYTTYTVMLILTVFSFYTMYLFLLLNCVINDLKEKDYFNALRNIVPITIYISITIFYYILIINRKTVGKLIDYINADYDKLNVVDDISRDIILDYAKKGHMFMFRWFYIICAATMVFVLKSMLISIAYKVKGEYRYVEFHEMTYPNFIEAHKSNNVYVYMATYTGEFFFSGLSSGINFCAVPTGIISVLHACGQLEIVKIKLYEIFESDDVDERLKDIATHLQSIYGFVADINKCFTTIYEVLLKTAIMLTSLSSYALVQSLIRGSFTFEYVTVLIGCLFMSGMNCYYGNLLLTKGEEMAQAVYECGWEKVNNIKARKTLLIILTRATRPIAVSSIFCTLSLDTFADVLRQSYTIFNLMRAAESL